jgi:hypothetical protein
MNYILPCIPRSLKLSFLPAKLLCAFLIFPRACYFFSPLSIDNREPSSSVSIVSGYGLDDRAIEVRFPAEAEGYCLQTCSGAHPVSCTVRTGGPFPGAIARPGRDADHSPPSSAEIENE